MPTTTTKVNIKQKLSQAFEALNNHWPEQAQSLLEEVNNQVKPGRAIVKPKSKCHLPIMGLDTRSAEPKIHQRAAVVEPVHNFQGTKFKATSDGQIVLRASNQTGAPWCELSFNSETHQPNFYIGILEPGQASHECRFE